MSRTSLLPWAAFVLALLLSVGASVFFDAWLVHLGPSLRELSVLVFAFGVFEKLWDAKVVKPSYFPWVLTLGLALYAFGAIVEPPAHGSNLSPSSSGSRRSGKTVGTADAGETGDDVSN